MDADADHRGRADGGGGANEEVAAVPAGNEEPQAPPPHVVGPVPLLLAPPVPPPPPPMGGAAAGAAAGAGAGAGVGAAGAAGAGAGGVGVAVPLADANANANAAGANGPAEAAGDDDVILRRATGFVEAVTILEDVIDRRPINRLVVGGVNADDDVAAQVADNGSFPRFVELLGQGGRVVRRIDFWFDVDWNNLPEEDMARLFRDVLPAHRTLTSIDMNISELPARFFKLMTEAIPPATYENSPAVNLELADEMIDQDKLLAVVNMLQQNAKVEELVLGSPLQPDQCKIIIQALATNTTLRVLSLRTAEEVAAGTLDGLATSSLRQLWITAPSYSEDAVSSLARQLRTNETLEILGLESTNTVIHDSHELLDLVRTYNCTLYDIVGPTWSDGQPLDAYLQRNRQIKHLVRLHGDFRNLFHFSSRDVPDLSQLSLLNFPDLSQQHLYFRQLFRFSLFSFPDLSDKVFPRVLAQMNCLPTVTYRTLRADPSTVARGSGRNAQA